MNKPLKELVSRIKSDYFVFKETDLKKIGKEKFRIVDADTKNRLYSFLCLRENALSWCSFSNLDFPNRYNLDITGEGDYWIRIYKKKFPLTPEKVKDDTLSLFWNECDFIPERLLEYNLGKIGIDREKINASKEIADEINKAKINFSELAGFYVISLPVKCRCEIIPNSAITDFLYLDHIKNCLFNIEDIKNFKSDTISAVWKVKRQLDNLKEKVIQGVETELIKKGINENDFFRERTDWREKIMSSFGSEEVMEKNFVIIKGIEKFSNSSSEEEKSQVIQESQDEAKNLEKEEQYRFRQEQERQKKQTQEQEKEFQKHLAEKREKRQNEEGKEDNNNSQPRTYNSKRGNKNNSLPSQQLPLIDITKIEKNENIGEGISITKTQIIQILKKYNLKTTDLPIKYQNWEEQLTKLTSKEQINSLVAEINQQIENKLRELKQNQKDNNQQPIFNKLFTLFIGGVIIIVIAFVVIKIGAKKKKIRPSKQI